MNRLKKVGVIISVLALVMHASLFLSGNLHFYKTLGDTIFKGRLAPSIQEHDNYPYRIIKASEGASWPKSPFYNKKVISSPLRNKIEEMKTAAFAVIHKDELLYEEYWGGFSDTTLSNTWSMSKSYVSMLIGVAIKEGKINSIDDPVSDYLPQFGGGNNAALTIKHLLTMSSGIDFGEQYLNPFGFMAKALYGDDVKDITLKHNVSYAPGTKWKYQGGNTILLTLILKEATGKTVSEYFAEKVWQPIGAKQDALWSLDKEEGNEKGYCCVFSNVLDFARIGNLMLNKGNWQGQQLIDSSYVIEGATPSGLPDLDGKTTDHYGYAWWIMNYKGLDIFYARGIIGQYTVIIPEKDLTFVRLGHKRIRKKGAKHPEDVYYYIDAALEMIES